MYQERMIEEGRAHVTSVISLLTCNNTTSCSRDPCIVSRSTGSRSRTREGGKRKNGPYGGRRGRGPKGAACTVRSWSSCPLFRNDCGESMTFAYHQIDLFAYLDRASLLLLRSPSTWLAPSRLENRFVKFGSPAPRYLVSATRSIRFVISYNFLLF